MSGTATIPSDGTSIVCDDCGHVRETSEAYPTLCTCKRCGSYNIHYDTDS